MELTIRPATPTEQLYAYKQSAQIAERCGNPGCLRGELDNTGTVFLNHWDTYVPSQNTPEFKAEFNTVLDMLRFDERYGHVLKNRAAMIVYCLGHSEGSFRNGFEYAFWADTQGYSYLIRCIPAGEDNHVYIYPYRRDLLDRHMKQAEKGIRFITPDGKEKFRGGPMAIWCGSPPARAQALTAWLGISTIAMLKLAAAFTISASLRNG